MQEDLESSRTQGLRIGFVPTMGALHEGHLALVSQAQKTCDVVVCSIFVNPTQFNDPADFVKYPKTVERDLELLNDIGCDYVYLPSVQEMYPQGLSTMNKYDLGQLEMLWEGAYRPGHFQGVCTVVQLLLEAVMPDALFMGKKDYQQVAVIRHVLGSFSLKHNVDLIVCDTVREESGLAMSSRNMRLTDRQKLQAAEIYKGFLSVQKLIEGGYRSGPKPLVELFKESLFAAGFETVDYVALCDPQTLTPIEQLHRSFVLLVAATIGGVRLIDNHTFEI